MDAGNREVIFVIVFKLGDKFLAGGAQELKAILIDPKKLNDLNIADIIFKPRLTDQLAQIPRKPIQLSLAIKPISVNKPDGIEHEDIQIGADKGAIGQFNAEVLFLYERVEEMEEGVEIFYS